MNQTNDGEFIRDLIRKKQARLDEMEAIRVALVTGEKPCNTILYP